MNQPPMNLVVRTEKGTGNRLICYHNGRIAEGRHVIDRHVVEAYDVTDRHHFEMSLDYYYKRTKPIKDAARAQELFDEYTKEWEGFSVPRLRSKLK
jgi:hypothetical protein